MFYQKPCLFNTTLLDWVTKCNTSFPQLPQVHIIWVLCEEKPPGSFLDSFRQDIGQFHSPQIGSNLVPKSLPFCKERALGWIWPVSVKWWKSVWILVCARVSFHFPFYFFGLQTKQCWDITSRLSQLEPYFLHPLFK